MATPVLSALARREEFFLLGRGFLEPLLASFPGVRGFIPLENGRWGVLRTARKLRAYGFRRGLLLPNSFSSALIFFLAGIPERVGYATDGRSLLLTRRIPRPDVSLHQRDYYLELLSRWGEEVEERDLKLVLSRRSRDRAARFLRGLTFPLAVLAPGAAYGPAKRWPPERFRALAAELCRRGFSVVLLGGAQEAPAGEELARDLPRVLNLCGKTDLAEAAAVIERAAVFVSNDSGLMHVAAALRRPQVALFGSTDPRTTAPLNPRAVVIRKDLPCSPCLKRTCPQGHYLCLRGISVEEVLLAALEVAEC